MANYNIITTQKGRTPLWSPEEVEVIMEHLDEGDATILESYNERCIQYIEDRHDQLVVLGVTEMEPIPMMAATFALVDREFPDFRGYLSYVKKSMAKHKAYIMPDQWRAKKSRRA